MTNSERLRQFREAAAPKERVRITAVTLCKSVRRSLRNKAFVSWMHGQPCLVASRGGCAGAITFHHVRKCGGKRDDHAGLALCERHHLNGVGPEAIHRLGKAAFQARFGVDIEAAAQKYWEAFSGVPSS